MPPSSRSTASSRAVANGSSSRPIPAPTTAPPNSWFASPATNALVTGGGALDQTFTDTGLAGASSAGPPSSTEAVESAYPQNPNLIPAFAGLGIQYFGSDASKPYPNPAIAGSTTAAYAAGQTFTDGSAQAVPRYPTNIYYNASTEAQELDEFNTLYTAVAQGGKCLASATTTCETAPATFAGVVSDVDTGMFQHVMGNDPRPDYFTRRTSWLTARGGSHHRVAAGDPAEHRRRIVLLGHEPAA